MEADRLRKGYQRRTKDHGASLNQNHRQLMLAKQTMGCQRQTKDLKSNTKSRLEQPLNSETLTPRP